MSVSGRGEGGGVGEGSAGFGLTRIGAEAWLHGLTLQHACSCPQGRVFGADVCARGIFRELYCRHPFGYSGERGNRGVLRFHVSIREASGVPPLKAQVQANVYL